MSNSQGSTNILKIIDNYDIIVYDVENVNPNKKLLVLDSNKGKVLIQRYFGTSKQLWLAYNVFKTLNGNDVLKITDWHITADGAPFIEADKKLYYCTKYNDTKLTAEVSLIDHMSFLAKWHYLSREIVYARDFADSLTTPRTLDKQIKEKRFEGNAEKLRQRIMQNLQRLNLYNYPEKKLTVTLPMFNIKRLVRKDDECLFQPWQQTFEWNWQLADIASILCFFKFDKTENIKEALSKYHKLNPLSEDEWKALPSLMLWNLCKEVNYDLVSDSYFDLYESLCVIVEERGIAIEDRIILPLDSDGVMEHTVFVNVKPEIVEDNVNIVVVNPKEVVEIEDSINLDNESSQKIVQFTSLDEASKQQDLIKKEIPVASIKINELSDQDVVKTEQAIVQESDSKTSTEELETNVELKDKEDEVQDTEAEAVIEKDQEIVKEVAVDNEIEEKKVKVEEEKVKLETLSWRAFPKSPFENIN